MYVFILVKLQAYIRDVDLILGFYSNRIHNTGALNCRIDDDFRVIQDIKAVIVTHRLELIRAKWNGIVAKKDLRKIIYTSVEQRAGHNGTKDSSHRTRFVF